MTSRHEDTIADEQERSAPSRKRVKPYELIPGHTFRYGYGGVRQTERRVDRVLIDSPTVVTVIVNGGSVIELGRNQELELINQVGD